VVVEDGQGEGESNNTGRSIHVFPAVAVRPPLPLLIINPLRLHLTAPKPFQKATEYFKKASRFNLG